MFESWTRRKAPDAADAPSVAGRIDGISDGRLQGWALDRLHPDKPVMVTLRLADGRALALLADRARADVHAAGHASAHAGFSVPLPRLAGSASVRAFAGGAQHELQNSPFDLTPPAKARAGRAGRFSFALDPLHASGALVSGWIVDGDDPARRCLVSLRRDGDTVAQARASRFRGDLADAPDPLHGFLIPLPDAGRERLTLVEAATGLVLGPVR